MASATNRRHPSGPNGIQNFTGLRAALLLVLFSGLSCATPRRPDPDAVRFIEGMRAAAKKTGQKPKDELPAVPEESKGKRDQAIEEAIARYSQKLTNEEKKQRTEKMLGHMRDARKRVTEVLAKARAGNDIVQLNCINAKLTQIKGLLKISEQASVKMYEALAANQTETVNHEFTKMIVAHRKVLILWAEAYECVGGSIFY